MTRGRVFELAAILTALLAACIYPTDKGDDLRIDVLPIPSMIRGDSLRVEARLLGPDGGVIPNARFVFSSADKSVAVVTTGGLVTAINAGATTITVRAVGTEGTPIAQARVAVNGTVSVDSLRPLTAKWGQVLSLYGAGLGPGSDQRVTVDGTPVSIESYQPDDPAHPERFGVLHLLAAPPLVTKVTGEEVSVVVATARGAGALVTPFTIEPLDIYESNTLAPSDLGTITGPREFRGLAAEAATLSPSDIDWYMFTTTTPSDWTIEVRPSDTQNGIPSPTFFPAGGVQAEALQGYPGNYYPTYIAYYPGTGSSVGGTIFCRGRGGWKTFPAAPQYGLDEETVPETVQSAYPSTLSLRNVPAGKHDLIVTWAGSAFFGVDATYRFYPNRRANQWAAIFEGAAAFSAASRYDLVIRPGLPSGPIAGDSYEPNDFCEDARHILTLGPRAFSDSVVDLTFDGPADHDWFRVDGETAGILQARYNLDSTMYGELVSVDTDSAVVVGDLGRGWFCGVEVPWLTSFGSDGCRVEGAFVQPGPYYLFVTRWPPGPAPYQLVFSWAPGAVPPPTPLRRGRL
jgi:hypothetical protein